MYKATNLTMIGNSIAGSEKVGLKTPGMHCDDKDSMSKVRDNEVKHIFLINNKLTFTKLFKFSLA